jgi:FkbM family methyltransferase
MLKTIEINNLTDKIMPVNKGLGDKISEMFIANNGEGAAAFFISAEPIGNDETAQIITIDNFVRENNLNIGLIKTDVEGFEINLLNGAKETIKAQRPIMLISIYHNARDFFEIKPLIESWKLNYRFQIRKYIASHIFGDTMLICLPN